MKIEEIKEHEEKYDYEKGAELLEEQRQISLQECFKRTLDDLQETTDQIKDKDPFSAASLQLEIAEFSGKPEDFAKAREIAIKIGIFSERAEIQKRIAESLKSAFIKVREEKSN